MKEAGKMMAKVQTSYKEEFEKRFRPWKETIEPKSSAFVRKEFHGLHDQKHKLAPVIKGPFQVVSNADTPVIL